VPYLRWRRHRFWGFDRVDAFLSAWRHPARIPEPAGAASASGGPVAALAPELAYDSDTAGGCG